MANFDIEIDLLSQSGGTYGYILRKNSIGLKQGSGFASIGAAMNAVRDDVAAELGTETVTRIHMNVRAQ